MAKKEKVLSDDEILRKALPEDPDIEREYNRLMDLFKDADPAALALQRKTIARAAFLSICCDRLERDVSQHGYKETYNNGGGQAGVKQSAAAQLLPQYTKLYLNCMKQLQDALQPSKAADELDEFELFGMEQEIKARIYDNMMRADAEHWINEHGEEEPRPTWVIEYLKPGGPANLYQTEE